MYFKKDFYYWNNMSEHQLKDVEEYLDSIEVDEFNFMNIRYADTHSIQTAIENVEMGEEERKKGLEIIKQKIEKLREEATVYGFRYQKGKLKTDSEGKEYFAEKRTDENLIKGLENAGFQRLGEEAGAGYVTANYIYTYLTNANDSTDLLKRLVVVKEMLEEYKDKLNEYVNGIEDVIKKVKSDLHYDEKTGAMDETKKDVLGLDKKVESER